MTIAFVQKTPNSQTPKQSTDPATTAAFGSSVGEGHLIIACCTSWRDAGADSSVVFTDSKGNTWNTPVDKTIALGNNRITVNSCKVASGKGGTGFTVTATGVTGMYEDLMAIEVSGNATTSWLGPTASASGHGYDLSSGTSATPAANALFVGMGESNSSADPDNWTDTWTSAVRLFADTNGTDWMPSIAAYKISATAETAIFSNITDTDWIALIVGYLESGVAETITLDKWYQQPVMPPDRSPEVVSY